VRRLEELRRQRDAAYSAAASQIIDTEDLSATEIADAVLDWARRVPGLLTPEERT
jgi:hypothetical protein